MILWLTKHRIYCWWNLSIWSKCSMWYVCVNGFRWFFYFCQSVLLAIAMIWWHASSSTYNQLVHIWTIFRYYWWLLLLSLVAIVVVGVVWVIAIFFYLILPIWNILRDVLPTFASSSSSAVALAATIMKWNRFCTRLDWMGRRKIVCVEWASYASSLCGVWMNWTVKEIAREREMQLKMGNSKWNSIDKIACVCVWYGEKMQSNCSIHWSC